MKSNEIGLILKEDADGTERWYFDRSLEFDYASWQTLCLQYRGCGYPIKTIIKLLKDQFASVINDRQIYNQIQYHVKKTGYEFRLSYKKEYEQYYKDYIKHHIGKEFNDQYEFTRNRPLTQGDRHRSIYRLTKEEKQLLRRINK